MTIFSTKRAKPYYLVVEKGRYTMMQRLKCDLIIRLKEGNS
jgi:hypothetical protein